MNTALTNESKRVPEFAVYSLLKSKTVAIRETYCQGTCRLQSTEERTTSTQLVFPFRGVYVRHLGKDQAVAEANQVLFFNAHEEYRISHPVAGGDASLTLVIDESQLGELAPQSFLRGRPNLAFRQQRLRIDAHTQAMVARLRHALRHGVADTLEAENLALTLAQRALGPRTSHAAGGSFGSQRLVDRVKLVLAGNLARRWTLAEIASELRCSPVYLTQVFQNVEGLPLYRYHLRLRLAHAMHLLQQYDDLTSLALDLGFSSHSHFSAVFRATYGRSPSKFRRIAPLR